MLFILCGTINKTMKKIQYTKEVYFSISLDIEWHRFIADFVMNMVYYHEINMGLTHF